MFVKTTNGNLSKFPYTLGELRRDNPQTSFPKTISDDTLASYGVYRVVEVDAPQVDSKTHRVAKHVANVDGVWTQTWTTQQLPEDRAAENVRGHRNSLLKETDWAVLQDSPLTDAQTASWVIYRQALRDITDHANFPYLEDADWPVKP